MLEKWKTHWPQILFVALVVTAVITAIVTGSRSEKAVETGTGNGICTLVIDAGHGGFDGGAISEDGTKESDINLAIALKMQCLAEFVGQKTVMTRTDDSQRTDYEAYSEHEDLVHRVSIANDTPNAVLFSIHQNDFPTGQPSGAQVLYSSDESSETLGKLTHANLIACLDPQNRRVAEPAPKQLFLTANATCPAILVECGFMSNNFDVLKLCDSGYQTSLSVVLVSSLLQYLSGTEQT